MKRITLKKIEGKLKIYITKNRKEVEKQKQGN